MAGDFTLANYRAQLQQIKRQGTASALVAEVFRADWPASLGRMERIIDAMTPEERQAPEQIDEWQRQQIATDSQTRPEEVEAFLAKFDEVRARMRVLASLTLWQRIKLIWKFAE